MKETPLPKDWIVATSKKRPGCVYYFNTKTNETSWERPSFQINDKANETQSATANKMTRTPRKRRPDEDDATSSPEKAPSTPRSERRTLKAKRALAPKPDEPSQSTSNETPQMKAMRQRILEKQLEKQAKTPAKKTKATAAEVKTPQREVKVEAKRPKAAEKVNETQKNAEKAAAAEENAREKARQEEIAREKARQEENAREKARQDEIAREKARQEEQQKKKAKKEEKSDENVPMEVETMTPAMKEYYEKMKARKSLAKPKKPDKVVEVTKVEPKEDKEDTQDKEERLNRRRTRARSMGPAPESQAGPSTPYHRRRTMFMRPKSDSDPEEDEPLSARVSITPQPRKNLAKERIEKLRRSLTTDSQPPEAKRIKKSPEKIPQKPAERFTPKFADQLAAKSLEKSPEKIVERFTPKFAEQLVEKPLDKSLETLPSKIPRLRKPSLPEIHENAEARMSALKEKLRRESQKLRDESYKLQESMDEADGSEPVVAIPDISYEAMDWEPIEDDVIMREIEVVRNEIGFQLPMEQQGTEDNGLDLVDGHVQSRKALYIVIDTNVFLSNIQAIEQARDSMFKTHGRPILVIPWTVIRELDYIKDDRSNSRPESLKSKARQAVRFLHRHFSAKHPRVLGQTARDVINNRELFAVECPDDEILQACLQIQKSQNSVVLLSYDKNLCTKAMIHDIATLGRLDPLEKIDYLMATEYRSESMLSTHLKQNGGNPRTTAQSKELSTAEDIFEETKAIIKDFLTVIVAKEMQNLYGENWEKYVIIPPPWTAITVLKCAIKHWMAAVNDSFIRRAETILKELHDIINKYELNRTLREVGHVLNLTIDLVQCVVMKKYPKLVERVELAIDDLKRRHDEAVVEVREDGKHEKRNGDQEIQRAEAAFKRFDRIYSFARDVCGATCESLGKPCAFDYRKFDPPPSDEALRNLQPEVAANLNRLLLVLSRALEDSKVIHKDHKSVIALYDAMESFISIMESEIDDEVSPMDVYLCLKHKEKSLRIGVPQLQGVIEEFCRLAAFRCL